MKMNALWWWIDRWRKSTAYTDMTLEEQGAYRNLLDEAQLRGGPLPTDERILAKACGDALAWSRVRDAVMSRFVLAADGWRNETLDGVIHESNRRKEKQQNYRHKHTNGNGSGNGSGNDTGNEPVTGVVTGAVSPSPSPSPSLISGSITGSKIKNVSSTPQAATELPVVPDPVVLAYPVVGSPMPTWSLTESQVKRWTELYPGTQVLAECRKALAWVEGTPSRRKTARGMETFLVNWLNRHVERRGSGPLPGKTDGNRDAIGGWIQQKQQGGGQ